MKRKGARVSPCSTSAEILNKSVSPSDDFSAGVGVEGLNCLDNSFRDSIEGEYQHDHDHDVSVDRVKGFFKIDKVDGDFFVVISHLFDDPSKDLCYRCSSLPKSVLISP